MIVRAPFTLTYCDAELSCVEDISIDYEVDEQEFECVQGSNFVEQFNTTVEVELTFLETDVASLAAVLPQHFVPAGGTLGDGTVVQCPDGAIDIIAGGCTSSDEPCDLIITPCDDDPCGVTKIHDVVTSISDIDFGDKIRKITVKFSGRVPAGSSVLTLGC